MAKKRIPVVCLVGPTAVGKTGLSLDLAEYLQCEIISADSMQVYRNMDVGTAKIPLEERRGITHYMIDVIEPTETFTAYDYAIMARSILLDCAKSDSVPLMVGGTGLYIRAVMDDLDFTKATRDEELRASFEQIVKQQGALVLHERLQRLDPDAASRIHPNDHKRMIRSLEIITLTGQPIAASYKRTTESPFAPIIIGLTMDRDILYARIDQRVDQMIDEGLVQEVESLLARGCTSKHTSMQAIGYKELMAYVEDRIGLQDAVTSIKQASRRYAKRQLSWFRADPRIQWYNWADNDMIKSISNILDHVKRRKMMIELEDE